MINTLKLKFFRQHEDLVIDFKSGLNVIRGANESGKTTLLEAILYAWFGAAALRDSLPEVVTWGHKETELKVTVECTIGGTNYVFTRSKSGAECNYGDKKVTGQKEVSSKAAEIIGADAKTAGVMMMASQAGLRGALDEGPTAVSGLMGKLADFDMIDRMLKNAETDLALGSDTAIKAKLVQAEADVEALRAAIPSPEAAAELARSIEAKANKLAADNTQVEVALGLLTSTETAYVNGRNAAAEREQLAADVEKAAQLVAETAERVKAAQAAAAVRPEPGQIEQLRTAVQRDADHQKVVSAFAAFQKIPAYPEVFWDEDKASFDSALAGLRTRHATLAQEIVGVGNQTREWARGRITSGKCPTCGSTTTSDEHIAAHNGALDAKIAEATAQAQAMSAELAVLSDDVNAMVAIDKEAQSRANRLASVPAEFVSVDSSQYPPIVTWIGGDVGAAPTGENQRELARLEAAQRAADVAAGQAEAHKVNLAEREAHHAALKQRLGSTPVVDLAPLAAAYNAAAARHLELSTSANTLAEELRVLREQAATLKAEAEQAQIRLDGALARITEYNKDLNELAFNNTLVAKLRKLKPAITDHLWNTVLAAVSQFFTMMRGEQSLVTKDSTGFKVNDRSVDSLSGSTIDVLALAIRVALTKTFVPHTSILTLDEPAHGCDTERTGNVLGFLSSIGIEQVILASHDELSESVADNLIQLGA